MKHMIEELTGNDFISIFKQKEYKKESPKSESIRSEESHNLMIKVGQLNQNETSKSISRKSKQSLTARSQLLNLSPQIVEQKKPQLELKFSENVTNPLVISRISGQLSQISENHVNGEKSHSNQIKPQNLILISPKKHELSSSSRTPSSLETESYQSKQHAEILAINNEIQKEQQDKKVSSHVITMPDQEAEGNIQIPTQYAFAQNSATKTPDVKMSENDQIEATMKKMLENISLDAPLEILSNVNPTKKQQLLKQTATMEEISLASLSMAQQRNSRTKVLPKTQTCQLQRTSSQLRETPLQKFIHYLDKFTVETAYFKDSPSLKFSNISRIAQKLDYASRDNEFKIQDIASEKGKRKLVRIDTIQVIPELTKLRGSIFWEKKINCTKIKMEHRLESISSDNFISYLEQSYERLFNKKIDQVDDYTRAQTLFDQLVINQLQSISQESQQLMQIERYNKPIIKIQDVNMKQIKDPKMKRKFKNNRNFIEDQIDSEQLKININLWKNRAIKKRQYLFISTQILQELESDFKAKYGIVKRHHCHQKRKLNEQNVSEFEKQMGFIDMVWNEKNNKPVFLQIKNPDILDNYRKFYQMNVVDVKKIVIKLGLYEQIDWYSTEIQDIILKKSTKLQQRIDEDQLDLIIKKRFNICGETDKDLYTQLISPSICSEKIRSNLIKVFKLRRIVCEFNAIISVVLRPIIYFINEKIFEDRYHNDNYFNSNTKHCAIEDHQNRVCYLQDQENLPSNFYQYLAPHIIKKHVTFNQMVFMQNMNSLYENLYDIEQDWELYYLIENLYSKSKNKFFVKYYQMLQMEQQSNTLQDKHILDFMKAAMVNMEETYLGSSLPKNFLKSSRRNIKKQSSDILGSPSPEKILERHNQLVLQRKQFVKKEDHYQRQDALDKFNKFSCQFHIMKNLDKMETVLKDSVSQYYQRIEIQIKKDDMSPLQKFFGYKSVLIRNLAKNIIMENYVPILIEKGLQKLKLQERRTRIPKDYKEFKEIEHEFKLEKMGPKRKKLMNALNIDEFHTDESMENVRINDLVSEDDNESGKFLEDSKSSKQTQSQSTNRIKGSNIKIKEGKSKLIKKTNLIKNKPKIEYSSKLFYESSMHTSALEHYENLKKKRYLDQRNTDAVNLLAKINDNSKLYNIINQDDILQNIKGANFFKQMKNKLKVDSVIEYTQKRVIKDNLQQIIDLQKQQTKIKKEKDLILAKNERISIKSNNSLSNSSSKSSQQGYQILSKQDQIKKNINMKLVLDINEQSLKQKESKIKDQIEKLKANQQLLKMPSIYVIGSETPVLKKKETILDTTLLMPPKTEKKPTIEVEYAKTPVPKREKLGDGLLMSSQSLSSSVSHSNKSLQEKIDMKTIINSTQRDKLKLMIQEISDQRLINDVESDDEGFLLQNEIQILEQRKEKKILQKKMQERKLKKRELIFSNLQQSVVQGLKEVRESNNMRENIIRNKTNIENLLNIGSVIQKRQKLINKMDNINILKKQDTIKYGAIRKDQYQQESKEMIGSISEYIREKYTENAQKSPSIKSGSVTPQSKSKLTILSDQNRNLSFSDVVIQHQQDSELQNVAKKSVKQKIEKQKNSDAEFHTKMFVNRMLQSISQKNIGLMEDILKRYQGNLNNILDSEGNNLLILATMQGDYKMADILLSKGIDVNCQNIEGNTALHYAILKGFNGCIDTLISYGVSEKIENYNGLSPWQM